MKKVFKFLVIPLFATCIVAINGCKKEPEIPIVKTAAVSGITANTAVIESIVTSSGGADLIDRGVCWSTSHNPTLADNKTIDGNGSGAFSSNLTGLEPNTQYYVRAYATNSAGRAFGNEISFTSGQGPTATVTTSAITAITSTSAVSGGEIIANGGATIMAWGICWSTSQNPTYFSDDASYGTVGDIGGMSVFICYLSGLNPATTYYVRAYVQNSSGVAYGDQLTFTTANATSTEGGIGPIIFNPDVTYGSVSDIDGNEYKTIQIDTQIWMAENLKTTKYNDGNSIPNVTDIIEWSHLTTGAYCWYNNDDAAYKTTYGALYNWYAVNTDKLCPTNWHVPSATEWIVLITYLGGESIAGGKLMETGTTHWLNPDPKATNLTGFTALPGGFRYTDYGFGQPDYPFDALGFHGFWWSVSEYSNIDAQIFHISSWDPSYTASADLTTIIKNGGMTVRCLKN